MGRGGEGEEGGGEREVDGRGGEGEEKGRKGACAVLTFP